MKTTLTLVPGAVSLAQWRRVWQGDVAIALDASAWGPVRASADAVGRIVAAGKPAYGINTGFGKLASSHIPEEQLELLQANLIRSHSVGVGALMDDAVVRLILAMKIASSRAAARACVRNCWKR